MKEMINMVVVLTILSVTSGGSLAFLRDKTKDRIEQQQLKFVKGPAIMSVLPNVTNDPTESYFKLNAGTKQERSFFVGMVDGKQKYVAFESKGKGFGGEIGLMIGVDLETDQVVGVGITTHAETPGLGSRAKTDPAFTNQFKGKPLMETFKVKSDGGNIDALSGATITSRGVSDGVTQAGAIYKELKPQILEGLKTVKK
ncbi:MAG: RnfABCDGE type electron transport complex subunit G [Desulfobacteraceae bacterium]|nr:RnfABCDGE type electron transport complex subunit G [Desulfobacteraceae bacterium]